MSKISPLHTRLLPSCAMRGLALAIGTMAYPLYATPIAVTSCGDAVGDMGTLRSKIAAAASGAVVSVATLTCTNSTISLGQGAIPIGVANLTIESSPSNHMAISGDDADRVFMHTGNGTLTLTDVTIERGSFTTPKFSHADVGGGCIYSTGGNVTLIDSTVTSCTVFNDTQRASPVGGQGAHGGAIAAPNGSVSMTRSTISFSAVDSIDATYDTLGGGISAHTLIAVDSVIHGCIAIGGSGGNSDGGGASVENVSISGSAIYDNEASFGGGLYIEGGTLGSTITNSTLSNNTAAYHGGAITMRNPLTLTNSTVAFNTSRVAAGIYVSSSPLTMQSSILANNADLTGERADFRLSSGTLSGSNNIITDTTDPLPALTITADPRLAPLGIHGGTTPVHALLAMSPALNAGSNPAGRPFDQRGTGFPRTSGTATDIGAYESQGIHDDELFYSGFEAFQ